MMLRRHMGSCEGRGRQEPYHGFTVFSRWVMTCPCYSPREVCRACQAQELSPGGQLERYLHVFLFLLVLVLVLVVVVAVLL